MPIFNWVKILKHLEKYYCAPSFLIQTVLGEFLGFSVQYLASINCKYLKI